MKKNRKAFIQLVLLDFPRDRCRRAMAELTGVTHKMIAEKAGTSRPSVTAAMVGRRSNAKVQKAMSDLWEIPTEELFADVA